MVRSYCTLGHHAAVMVMECNYNPQIPPEWKRPIWAMFPSAQSIWHPSTFFRFFRISWPQADFNELIW
jgi:hypothetical protein